eukprot:1349996-Prymnesium_polylepis.1
MIHAQRTPFARNGDKRLFHRLVKVRTLLSELPPETPGWVLGAEAAAQVRLSGERAAMVARLVEAKAGPKGGNAAKALRAWRLLC